jgi:uncharacterized membrane protein
MYFRALSVLTLFVALTSPARADLEICNRTSFVIEAALGIESKGVAATRGWFRVDPGACRPVLRGDVQAERLFVHARALPLYGMLRPLSAEQTQLCAGEGDFLVAGAAKCTKPNEQILGFSEVKPRKSEPGLSVSVAESAGYDPEQARFAAIQRLLTLVGFDAEPIDGVPGTKSEMALAAFLKSRNLPSDTPQRGDFLNLLIAAARDGQAPGLAWCNDTQHVVMASLAIEEGNEIAARGWWRIEAGACLRPELPRRIAGRVFAFAEAVDASGAVIERKGRPLSWGGATRLCVKNVRFEIREHENCQARGLDVKGFAPVDLASQGGATLRFREP